MNVNLTPELDQMVHEKVNSGLYNSASEVIREALRLMQEKDEFRRMRLDELRREINIGLEQARRGESAPIDFEELKAEGRRRRALRGSK